MISLRFAFGQQGFWIFGISVYDMLKNILKVGFPLRCFFLPQNQALKFPLCMPSEADCVMKFWQRVTSLQEHCKALCYYFACLTIAVYFAYFVVFLLKQQWPELGEFHVSWHDITTHSGTQNLFCTPGVSLNVVNSRATAFHRWAKLFDLKLFLRKTFY